VGVLRLPGSCQGAGRRCHVHGPHRRVSHCLAAKPASHVLHLRAAFDAAPVLPISLRVPQPACMVHVRCLLRACK
jgi:hypothetical protein